MSEGNGKKEKDSNGKKLLLLSTVKINVNIYLPHVGAPRKDGVPSTEPRGTLGPPLFSNITVSTDKALFTRNAFFFK